MLERYLKIAKVNWKHNLLPHALIAVLLCGIAPLIMGVKNLDEPQVAKVIEFYLEFLGMVLLIPLFLPDTDKDIRDLTASKKTPITVVRIIRLLEALLCLSILLLLFLSALKMGECDFHYGKCFYAAMSNCIFLGGLGLLFYSVIDNIAIAYMMPFLYYVTCLGGGKKYLGRFWLLGFTAGSIEDKKYILAVGVLMTLVSLFIREKNRG